MDSAFTALDSHFGMRPGLLHSPTRLAGSPLAMLFNYDDLVKEEFRAAAGSIRVVERALTA
jgi:hypothetical protein